MLNENKKEIEAVITDIIEIVNKFPEKFQTVLLEILLLKKLDLDKKGFVFSSSSQISEFYSDFILPIDVRAFFIQYALNEDLLKKLFYIENNQISPIWKLKTTQKSNAQIQVSLLLALENALSTGKFEFNYEEVREKCKELMVYDSPNYSGIFRGYSENFKSFDDKEKIALSPEGKARLANVILEIANE